MKRRLLLTLPALAACSVLPDRPYVEVKRFPLNPQRVAPPVGGAGRPVLLLRLMRAAPGQDSRGLRSIRADGTEALDYYAEWSAPPAELAEEALRRWLEASGRFAAVVTPGSRARYGLVLEAELTVLQADLGRREAKAGISAVLLRERADGPQLLAQLAVSGTAPLPADAATQPVPPEILAAAMTAAFSAALAALERGLAVRI